MTRFLIYPPADAAVHWGPSMVCLVVSCYSSDQSAGASPIGPLADAAIHLGPSPVGLVVSRYSSDLSAGAPTHGLSHGIS